MACVRRLDKIKDVSGGDVANKMLMRVLGKDDFDMEEFDRAMAAAFDDSYYEVGCALSHTATECTPLNVGTCEVMAQV